jgi:hypothetical protein
MLCELGCTGALGCRPINLVCLSLVSISYLSVYYCLVKGARSSWGLLGAVLLKCVWLVPDHDQHDCSCCTFRTDVFLQHSCQCVRPWNPGQGMCGKGWYDAGVGSCCSIHMRSFISTCMASTVLCLVCPEPAMSRATSTQGTGSC